MKKVIFILSVLIASVQPCVFAQPYFSKEYDLWNTAKGAELSVLGRIANVRSAASLTATLTDSLVCGSKVIVEEVSGTQSAVNGITAPWLRVKYRKDGAGREGYLWLGMLSLGHYESGSTGFLYGIDKVTAGTTKDDYTPVLWQVSVKVIDSNMKVLDEKKVLVNDVDIAACSGKLLGKTGLKNVDEVLRIQFGGEACGIPTNYYYFAWTGRQLLSLPGKMEVGDAGVFYHTETLLFPAEPGGQADKLILLTEEGTNEDDLTDKDGNPLFKVSKSRRVYNWDGRIAIPPKAH